MQLKNRMLLAGDWLMRQGRLSCSDVELDLGFRSCLPKLAAFRCRRGLGLLALVLAASGLVTVATGATIRIAADSDVGEGGKWTKARTLEWAAKTGNQVEYLNLPPSANDVLTLFSQYWAAQTPDLDIYQIDVCWPGMAAPHAVDLKKYFSEQELAQFFPRIVENNTVNGRLIGIPFFTDAGLLYYRTDLLEKYGYKVPPETWEELTDEAAKIQAGERAAGDADFWGFVWQGSSYEGLTCDGLEWIYSYGGGTIIERDGTVSIDNPNALKALKMAKGWVGTISPRGVTNYKEEESRNVWQSGHAAFMRNWPYAYALGSSKESPIAGKFSVTVLPKGGPDGKHAATLGGWQLMVSKYSKNPDIAADLVKYLTSAEIQKRDAIELTRLPTRPALYRDKDVLATVPWFASLLPVFTNAVARPSTILGADYNRFATMFFNNLNQVLNDQKSEEDALRSIAASAQRFVPNK
jgi:trehalose/maltose transport system substrate-binding protein